MDVLIKTMQVIWKSLKNVCLDVFAGVNWSKTAVSNKFMALLTAEFCAYDHHFLLMRKR